MKRQRLMIMVAVAALMLLPGVLSGAPRGTSPKPKGWTISAPKQIRSGETIAVSVTNHTGITQRYYQPRASNGCGRIQPAVARLVSSAGVAYWPVTPRRRFCTMALIPARWILIPNGATVRLWVSTSWLAGLNALAGRPLPPGTYTLSVYPTIHLAGHSPAKALATMRLVVR